MKSRNTTIFFLLLCTTTCAVAVGRMTIEGLFRTDTAGPSTPNVSALEDDVELLKFSTEAEFAKASYWDPEISPAQLQQSGKVSISRPARHDDVQQYACLVDIPVSGVSPPPTATEVEELPAAPVPPSPLEIPNNAVAIPGTSDAERTREAIREAMPNANKAERDIWQQQLEGMSPSEIRFLLSQRQQFAMPFTEQPTSSFDLPAPETQQPAINSSPLELEFPHVVDQPTSRDHISGNSAASICHANIRNALTIGYRQRNVFFSPRRNIDGPLFSVRLEQSSGKMTTTDRQLDLAIDGPGYFELTDANGEKFYCRSAPFVLADGRIVLDEGNTDNQLVLIEGVPSKTSRILIDDVGTVQAKTGTEEAHSVGRLSIAAFFDSSQLEPVGQSLFRTTSRSGDAILDHSKSTAKVLQGRLENSNVDVELQQQYLEELRFIADSQKN